MVTAVKNKPRPRDLCPDCWKDGKDTDLIYRPGGRYSHFCSEGHQWDDRKVLADALMEMAKVKRAVEPEPVAPPPPPDAIPPAPPDNRMRIEDIDLLRLQSILGNFTDSSSMFGAVFAMNEQMKEMREQVTLAESRASASQIKAIGGDVVISVVIPERHVESITDISKSGQMTMEKYMNDRIEDGLDNAWYL